MRKALGINPGSFVTVIGCYAQLKPEEIAAMEGVDLVLGATEKFKLHEYLGNFTKKENAEIHSCEINDANFFVSSYSPGSLADCMRLVPAHSVGHPELDGPGSFGPLHETLSLDCLTFNGVMEHDGKVVAILRDEKGVSYRVKSGDYVGENAGRISQISSKRITIVQFVRNAQGDLIELKRYMFLSLGQKNLTTKSR